MAAIALLGFSSAFLGAIIGFMAAIATKRMGRRMEGAVEGFTAGLLIAFVCFSILKEGFAAAPTYVGTAGILLGVAGAAVLDGFVSEAKKSRSTGGERTAAIIALGIMLHHLPEGIALGGITASSLSEGMAFAFIIALHCVPESAAIFIHIERKNLTILRLILISTAISVPMMAGAAMGMILKEVSNVFLSLALTFAGGVMIYITCGEMLPDAKRVWNGRLTTVCSALGFILGVVITA